MIVGRSNMVGKPMAQLLLRAELHGHHRPFAHPRPAGVCRRADILVAAVGSPEFVRGDWIKPGAVVIDVGINRVTERRRQDPPGGRRRLRRGRARSPAPSRRCRAASGR